ncbi:hypothetical protein [Streptomyces sp. KR80]|uniref:hypothetical protein n=1 Tax=Streptomyces sp. KR80 TaxID=3457426 RepID=UPI003FD0CA0F
MIVSNTKNAVWTAAHCLHAGKGGGFYKNFVFIPAYKNGLTPWGWWFQDRVIVPSKWAIYSDYYSSDLGALIVKKDLLYGNLQDAIGAYGYNFSDGPAYSDVHSYGYPADGYNRPDSDFGDGEYLMYCRGNTVDGGPWDLLDERLRMNCDMGHGASGGPMVTGIATGNVRIVGVNSHRYTTSSGAWADNHLYSSEHASEARSSPPSITDPSGTKDHRAPPATGGALPAHAAIAPVTLAPPPASWDPPAADARQSPPASSPP